MCKNLCTLQGNVIEVELMDLLYWGGHSLLEPIQTIICVFYILLR
jgi:hypothetical protein